MDCPKCLGKLQEIAVEKVKIDTCTVCEGIWFDKDELEKVISRDAFDLKHIDLDRDRFDSFEIPYTVAKDLNEKEGKCPRCDDGTVLKRKEHEKTKGLFIDICPNCKGIWLDGGEIRYLRQHYFKDLADKMLAIKEFIISRLRRREKEREQ